MLLLPRALLDARRAAASGSLSPLADSLAADLEPVLAGDVYVPEQKALLSPAGGRCPDDGATLEFDPFSPREHRCPMCGAIVTGEVHERAWLYPYQLWLAERAVHGALIGLLRDEPRCRDFAAGVLERYAEVYLHYPNRDNVLGPSRVFFSTYLESIWLLQICLATDLLAVGGATKIIDLVCDRIVEPAAAIIAQFDEGGSNRQVWNNAALMAASLLTAKRGAAETIVYGASGVEAHLARCLLPDGTWYEGDNYHVFAHRGLWYCVTLAETAGISLQASLLRRFDDGFALPFATALPDFTMPSRKDSPYGVSLRQWRFAEMCELGLARRDDQRLLGALHRLYDDGIAPGDTGRSRSSAEVERNVPPVRLSRADLGWRALLHARATLPQLVPAAAASVHLEHQGFTVFRRDEGRVYVALDWGQSGGGHGHPDRLNVIFVHDKARWLDDLGTGSYVDRSLHWYRSTLAHNAPLANGRSQDRVSGRLRAYDERGGVGWILADADIAPGVRVERALVVTPDYFVDELRWAAEAMTRLELPIHCDATPDAFRLEDDRFGGGDGVEDGFDFVSEAASAPVSAGAVVELRAASAEQRVRAWIVPEGDAVWFRVHAPGQPAAQPRAFHVLRMHGMRGAVRAVWAWSPRVTAVHVDGDHIAVWLGSERHEHARTPEYWQMELVAGEAKSGIELFGWRSVSGVQPVVPRAAASAAPAVQPTVLIRGGPPLRFRLGQQHYRRSEETWLEAGCPMATVEVSATARELELCIVAGAGRFKHWPPRGDPEPLDNENPDIHYPGVQVYVRTPNDGGAWLVRPEILERVARTRKIPGWGNLQLGLKSGTVATAQYELRLHVELPREAATGVYPVWLDVLVNDAPAGRARRRGQLVLSGAEGEFVYLRGDRHDPARLVPLLITDGSPGA